MAGERKTWLIPLGFGLFFGVLFTVPVASVLTGHSDKESFREFNERTQPPNDPGGGDPHAAGGVPRGRDRQRAEASSAKSHFMKAFVAALTAPPRNEDPNLDWGSPLVEGAQVQCADCHDPAQFNIEAMKAMDPGHDAVEPYRRSRDFMVPLMRQWVERLNAELGDRLKEPVTCATCHADDPGKGLTPGLNRQQSGMVYAYFMQKFVKALSEKPSTMKEPSPRWKPLLKEGAAVLCSTCHKGPGINMDPLLDGEPLPRPGRYADNHEFVEHLMGKWVRKLNREAKGKLAKTVVCKDCHAKDPR